VLHWRIQGAREPEGHAPKSSMKFIVVQKAHFRTNSWPTRLLIPSLGALPLDPAGGSALDPRYRFAPPAHHVLSNSGSGSASDVLRLSYRLQLLPTQHLQLNHEQHLLLDGLFSTRTAF